MTNIPGWRPLNGPGSRIPLLLRSRLLSPELQNFRDLVVALPAGYAAAGRRYPVVYMQDGQNLFDSTTSYAGDWHLSDTLGELDRNGVEAIVVGIAHAGRHRLDEYSPYRDRRLGGGLGARYLAFVAETVKPLIDRDFRTLPERQHTSIAGSSMGGLISLHAWVRHAETFGGVGALSPSIWFADRAVLGAIREAGRLAPVRIYLDIGLDEPASAVEDVRRLRALLEEPRLAERVTLDYVEDAAGAHDEATWGRRVSRVLPFLIGAAAVPAGG